MKLRTQHSRQSPETNRVYGRQLVGQSSKEGMPMSLWFWLTVVNVPLLALVAIAILKVPMLEQRSPRERFLEQQRRSRRGQYGAGEK
jgi:hypothetical protein